MLIKHPRVEQFVLHLIPPPRMAGLDQICVGVGGLRIFVEILHVRVSRRTVEIKVILLHVLAMITLTVGQAEQALFQNRVFSIPQGHREAQPLLVIGNSGQAVFAPAVRPRPGLVMTEVIPRIAPFAVVLSNRSPLAFAEVRPPLFPGGLLFSCLFQSYLFRGHDVILVSLMRQTKHVFVMTRYSFEFGLIGWLKRQAVLPGIIRHWQYPQISIPIANDPLLSCPVDIQENWCHSSATHGPLPPSV